MPHSHPSPAFTSSQNTLGLHLHIPPIPLASPSSSPSSSSQAYPINMGDNDIHVHHRIIDTMPDLFFSPSMHIDASAPRTVKPQQQLSSSHDAMPESHTSTPPVLMPGPDDRKDGIHPTPPQSPLSSRRSRSDVSLIWGGGGLGGLGFGYGGGMMPMMVDHSDASDMVDFGVDGTSHDQQRHHHYNPRHLHQQHEHEHPSHPSKTRVDTATIATFPMAAPMNTPRIRTATSSSAAPSSCSSSSPPPSAASSMDMDKDPSITASTTTTITANTITSTSPITSNGQPPPSPLPLSFGEGDLVSYARKRTLRTLASHGTITGRQNTSRSVVLHRVQRALSHRKQVAGIASGIATLEMADPGYGIDWNGPVIEPTQDDIEMSMTKNSSEQECYNLGRQGVKTGIGGSNEQESCDFTEYSVKHTLEVVPSNIDDLSDSNARPSPNSPQTHVPTNNSFTTYHAPPADIPTHTSEPSSTLYSSSPDSPPSPTASPSPSEEPPQPPSITFHRVSFLPSDLIAAVGKVVHPMAVAAGVALRFDRPLREGRVSAHPETIAALRLALSQAVGVVIAMMVGADDVDAFVATSGSMGGPEDMDIRTPFANHESGRQRVSSTSSTASNDPIPTHASVSALRDRLERQRRTGVAVTLAFDLVDRPVAGVVLEASVCASVGRGRIGEGGRAALEVVAGELRDRLEWHRRVVEVGGGGLKVSKDEGMGIVAVDCGIAVVRDL